MTLTLTPMLRELITLTTLHRMPLRIDYCEKTGDWAIDIIYNDNVFSFAAYPDNLIFTSTNFGSARGTAVNSMPETLEFVRQHDKPKTTSSHLSE